VTLFRRLAFSFWYFGSPPWDTGISPPELLAFLDTTPPGRAIDLGCGTGTNLITLAQHGWQVLGVDFAPSAIRRARNKIARAGLRADVLVGDVTRLKGISGPYDFALDLGCFHGLSPEEKRRYLDRLIGVLAPGGYWMIYGRIGTGARGSYGLAPEDISLMQSRLTVVSRQDGFNRRRNEPAAYFLFRKPAQD
jgi:SAM-dependent methyltransferase